MKENIFKILGITLLLVITITFISFVASYNTKHKNHYIYYIDNNASEVGNDIYTKNYYGDNGSYYTDHHTIYYYLIK